MPITFRFIGGGASDTKPNPRIYIQSSEPSDKTLTIQEGDFWVETSSSFVIPNLVVGYFGMANAFSDSTPDMLFVESLRGGVEEVEVAATAYFKMTSWLTYGRVWKDGAWFTAPVYVYTDGDWEDISWLENPLYYAKDDDIRQLKIDSLSAGSSTEFDLPDDMEVTGIGGMSGRLFCGLGTEIAELHPVTGGIIRRSGTIANCEIISVGGISDRMFCVMNMQEGTGGSYYYCEFDPDTFEFGDMRQSSDRPLAIGGIKDRLYMVTYNGNATNPEYYICEISTSTLAITRSLDAEKGMVGIGGTADRLFATTGRNGDGNSRIFELDPTTLYEIGDDYTFSSSYTYIYDIGGVK